jgi:hypothetical protein
MREDQLHNHSATIFRLVRERPRTIAELCGEMDISIHQVKRAMGLLRLAKRTRRGKTVTGRRPVEFLLMKENQLGELARRSDAGENV